MLVLLAGALLAGCAETPRQPVMRPIPPPPSTPPPGLVYVPQTVVTTNSPALTELANYPPGFEVSSNFVANAQSATPGSPVQVGQPVPQYEMVPPQPGPDYIWRNGYWRWEGAWVWIPGEWVYRPPQVIIAPGWYYPPPYYGRGYHGHYHRW